MNILAPFCSTGYGVVGSNLAKSLSKRTGVCLFPIGQFTPDKEDFDELKDLHYRNKVFSTKEPSLRIFHQFSMAEHVGSPKIGYPVFEKTTLNPQELNNLDNLDIIISPTEFQSEIIRRYGLKCETVPYGWSSNLYEYIPPPKRTTFLCVGKWELRKGQDFAIKAFNAAFTKKDDVRLIMHCDNLFDKTLTLAYEQFAKNTPLGDKIHISKWLENRKEVVQLMQESTCGVFLSRAEGWNLELSEMMALGRQVICTDYSGHTQYVNNDNAHLVYVQTEEAKDGGMFQAEESEWACLDDIAMQQAVISMRYVHENNQLKNEVAFNQARENTWDKTADTILSLI